MADIFKMENVIQQKVLVGKMDMKNPHGSGGVGLRSIDFTILYLQ